MADDFASGPGRERWPFRSIGKRERDGELREAVATKANNDHNVYILGAGFSAEAGFPLIRDFMNRMRDAADWLEGQGGREREVQAIEQVLAFRLRASAAGYRIPLELENVEELFSLASANGGEELAQAMILAIAATLDFARSAAPAILEHQRFVVGTSGVTGWKAPEDWIAAPTHVQRQVGAGQPKAEWYACPPYHLYVGVIGSYFNMGGPNRRDTIITFNYDTLVEDTLRSLGVSFSHGVDRYTGWTTREGLTSAQRARDGIRVLKIHGSVSWGRMAERLVESPNEIDTLPNGIVRGFDREIVAFQSYNELRESGSVPVLVAPTWQKTFAGYLSAVRDAAVSALSTATRLVIIGYSIPPTDQHFRYLLAAGLQENISLRKVYFVNPGLGDEKSRKELEDRLFALFRREHFEHGVIELVPTDLREFLGGPRIVGQESFRVRIGRELNPPGSALGEEPWTLISPYGQRVVA